MAVLHTVGSGQHIYRALSRCGGATCADNSPHADIRCQRKAIRQGLRMNRAEPGRQRPPAKASRKTKVRQESNTARSPLETLVLHETGARRLGTSVYTTTQASRRALGHGVEDACVCSCVPRRIALRVDRRSRARAVGESGGRRMDEGESEKDR